MKNPECIFSQMFADYESDKFPASISSSKENDMNKEHVNKNLLHEFNSLVANSRSKPKKIKVIVDFEDGSSNFSHINLTDDLPETWIDHKVPKK